MKNKYKIHDIAKKLNLKKHVIRYWEKEFEFISENKSDHSYSQQDLNLFEKIKNLIYEKKLSVDEIKIQVQSILAETKSQEKALETKESETFMASHETTISNEINICEETYDSKTITPAKEQDFMDTSMQRENGPKASLDSSDFFNRLELLKENLLKLKEKLD